MAKKLLTARERILLYLLNYSSKEIEDYLSPKALTQEGIGEAIGLGRNNVPREMKKLLNLKLVSQKKVRVNGFRNRRSVYFLTPEGVKEAKKIKERIKDIYITVTDLSGNLHHMKLKDVPRKFGTDFVSSALFVTKDNKLDLMDLFGINNGAVHMIQMDFKIRYFYGRKKEMARMKSWLKSKKKILMLTGISGSGKTTLVNKFVKDYLKKRNLVWFQVEKWVSAVDLIIKMSNFLSKIGKSKLERYIKQSLMGFEKDLRWENAYQILKSDLRNEVLIFDGLENAGDDVKELLRRLIGMVDETKELRIILIGTEIPPGIVPASKMVFLEEMSLGDLDMNDAITFLVDNGKTVEEAKKIIANYGATPLVLELMAKNGEPKLVRKHFIENVIYSLSDKERKALELASIFRYPFKPNFLLLNDVDYISLYSLVNKNIVMETDDERLLLHRTIRDFIYKNLPPSKAKEYHHYAARYLEEDGDYLEAVYHYINADEIPIATRLLTENYKKYMMKGKLKNIRELTYSILNKYDLSVGDHEWELYGILAITYEMEGNIENALENYLKARDLSKHRDTDFYVHTLVEIADIYRKRGEYATAKRELEESLKYIMNVSSPRVSAKARFLLGLLSLYSGDTYTAEEHFNEALKISEESRDYEALGYAYLGLGILYRHTNSGKIAIEYFHRAKNYFEVSGNRRDEAKALGNIGLVYYDQYKEELDEENLNLAENYFTQALKIFEAIGDKWNIALTKRNLAAIYGIRGYYNKSLEILSQAEIEFQEMGSLDILPSLYLQFGYIYTDMEDVNKAKEYFDKAISLAIQLGNEYRAVKYAEFAANKLERFGDVEEYRKIAKGERKVVAVVTTMEKN